MLPSPGSGALIGRACGHYPAGMADGTRPRASSLDRPLGFAESVCAEMFDRVPCGLQVVAAARLRTCPTAATLEASASAARRRHPVLSSVIERVGGDGSSWWFRPGPDGAPDVRIVDGGRWHDRYEAALAEPLEPSRALWRVELVRDPTDDDRAAAVLLVVGHHAALDGVAAAALVAELVGGDDGTAPMAPALAMEDLLDGAASVAPAPGASAPGAGWPVARPAAAGGRRLALTTRELGPEVIDPVHRAAHAEHTTVNAVLMALLCDVHDELSPGGAEIGFNVPADVRGRVTPALEPDRLGAYFARPHVWATRQDDQSPRAGLWDRARSLEDAFTRDLGACRAAATPPTPGQVADMAASIVDAGRTQFDLSYLLTNLGPLDLGPGVTGLWFTTVQTAGVEAVVVSAAGVAGGLQVTVAWPEPLLRPETGMAVADGLVSRLTELAASC